MRIIEFTGGPLDGARPAVPDGQDRIVVPIDGNVAEYVRDEIVEGPRVREVFRFVSFSRRADGNEA